MNEHTLQSIRTMSPFPWRSQINFDGMGGCRMIDANNAEVALLTIIAFAGIMSSTLHAEEARAAV